MIKPVLLLLLLAVTITVGQRRSGRDPPQADNTGSWDGDVLCTDERSCREYWRDVGLSYAEYYAILGLGRIRSQHRHGSSNQDRRTDSSDSSSSSSSSSSEESSRRGRRSVDSEEENDSDENYPYISDYTDDRIGEDGQRPDDSLSPVSRKSLNVENIKNHRNIRSVYDPKTGIRPNFYTDDLVNGGFFPIDPSGYWRRRQRGGWRFLLGLKRNGNYNETPGTVGIFQRNKAPIKKPCKFTPWLGFCEWKERNMSAGRRLPSSSRATSEPKVRSTATPAKRKPTRSTRVPTQEQSSVSTSGPTDEPSTTQFLIRPVIT